MINFINGSFRPKLKEQIFLFRKTISKGKVYDCYNNPIVMIWSKSIYNGSN